MKSCVYQKQDPVDVPKVETQTLKDILSLPFGAEIVMLLMSWNPLRLSQSLPVQQVILALDIIPGEFDVEAAIAIAGSVASCATTTRLRGG